MKTLTVTLTLVMLSACGEHGSPGQTVSWYLAHDAERKAKFAWCLDDAERKGTADCKNAMDAQRKLAMGSQSSLPPIDWNAKPKAP